MLGTGINMEDYNVLVLMEKDSRTGYFSNTVDSYVIRSGLETVESIYLIEEPSGYYVHLILTTRDVADWEYYGIYDLYEEAVYGDLAEEILDGSGEYNPRWIFKIGYSEDRSLMAEKINEIIRLHKAELSRILPLLEADKEKYMGLANDEESAAKI